MDSDLKRVLSLVHEPDSPTVVAEVLRRINAYNRLRIRDMNYFVYGLKDVGLSREAYTKFSSELKNMDVLD